MLLAIMPITTDTLKKFLNPVFVETGTHRGGGVRRALEAGFKTVYSIEIEDELFQQASERFKNKPEVHLFHGDSAVYLPEVLNRVTEPATFWLDSHIMGPHGNPDAPCPLLKELQVIASHDLRTHKILIDDRRLLESNWNVQISEVLDHILAINSDYVISFEDGDNTKRIFPNDIICVQPPW